MIFATIELVQTVAAAIQAAALLVAGVWAWYLTKEYRERKNLIQLYIDAHLYALDMPITTAPKTWKKHAEKPTAEDPRSHPTRWRYSSGSATRTYALPIFNAKIGVNTMRTGDPKFDKNDGHLHLTRVVTSGNIVPPFWVPGKPLEETAFYYIEPGDRADDQLPPLVPEPRELLQIVAEFSLAQRRIFPKDLPEGLYPHTAARTYRINSDGELVGRDGA